MNKKKLIIGIITCIVIAGGGLWFFTGKSSKNKIQLETAQAGRSSISNNDVVKAGQVIALMDKVTLEAELASSEAQLESSRVEYEYQQKNYARNKVLFEKKLISDSDYETAT